MDKIVAALSEQHAELAGLLNGLDEPDFERPAPSCEGWTIADVVLHLAQTDEFAIAQRARELRLRVHAASSGARTGRTASNVDEAAELMVVAERGTSGAAVRERWQTERRRAARGASRRAIRASGCSGCPGDMSARTLATTRLAETWIHTGDVAEALGVELPPPDRLWHIARLAWRTVPYAFARSGRELSGPGRVRARCARTASCGSSSPSPSRPRSSAVTRIDLCRVAARRVDPADTTLRGEGPDADAVLELVRTYA